MMKDEMDLYIETLKNQCSDLELDKIHLEEERIFIDDKYAQKVKQHDDEVLVRQDLQSKLLKEKSKN